MSWARQCTAKVMLGPQKHPKWVYCYNDFYSKSFEQVLTKLCYKNHTFLDGFSDGFEVQIVTRQCTAKVSPGPCQNSG
jgi:hypothetical protein